MVRNRVALLALGFRIIGFLIGAAPIVGMPGFSTRPLPPVAGLTPRLPGPGDAAQADRCASPPAIPGTVAWRFSEMQPDWKSTLPTPTQTIAGLERTKDALRVTLFADSGLTSRSVVGGVYLDLPDWRREEWAEVLVCLRTTSTIAAASVGLNPWDGDLPAGAGQSTFQTTGGVIPIVGDGGVRSYRILLDWGSQRTGPWRRLGLLFQARRPVSVDILSVRVVPVVAGQPQDRIRETMLERPQLQSDFALFRRALEEAHPALYRYTTKRAMDAEFARAQAKLTRPMTILQFRNVLSPVLAAVKDGHIGFGSFQGDEISAVLERAKQFPLALTFESKHAFVVLNQGLDERVKPGMQVLTINGKSLAEILKRILPNLSGDGDSRSRKGHLLGFSLGCCQWGRPGRAAFSEFYRLYIEDPPSFRTTLRDQRTRKTLVVDLAGVTVAEAAVDAEKNPVNRDVLAGIGALLAARQPDSIRYLDGESTAILMPGFRQNFPNSLEKAFAELRNTGTKNLIVDMRGNGGGFDLYPVLLFSYLISKEFRSNEPNYIKTFQPSFKQYTTLGDIDSVTDPYLGSAAGMWRPDPSGGWLMTEKYGRQYGSTFVSLVGMHKPAENHFDGTVYVLIDGGCFSACSEFAETTALYKRATFIGEETGGAAASDDGGSDIGPTLPESLLHLEISMEAYYQVSDRSNTRRGTLPKYPVVPTSDDLMRGRDAALEFTRRLIRSGMAR